jgi:RNA polymerase-binding transcription factor DksA
MSSTNATHFRDLLTDLARRVGGTAAALEEAARTPTSGEAAGSLSNVPQHLGDVGSEVYAQELNATLLENEAFIRSEVDDALDRLDNGTFGTCENCRGPIPEERLEALPYARFCTPCAERLQAGKAVNLNDGRPAGWGSTLEHPAALAAQRRSGEKSPTTAPRTDGVRAEDEDLHAVGTPGGGTAVGGLAGTNVGDGDPADAALEEAMGSGNFDVTDEGDRPAIEDAYSGPAGGAVGGTPANKRSVGGRARSDRGT